MDRVQNLLDDIDMLEKIGLSDNVRRLARNDLIHTAMKDCSAQPDRSTHVPIADMPYWLRYAYNGAKIAAIKEVREFSSVHFNQTMTLLESKRLVESVTG